MKKIFGVAVVYLFFTANIYSQTVLVEEWGYLYRNGWSISSTGEGGASLSPKTDNGQWGSLVGKFSDTLSATNNDAVIVKGKLEIIGDDLDLWNPIRYGIFYFDSLGILQNELTDSVSWSGSEEPAYGYMASPQSSNHGIIAGQGGGGNLWSTNGGNWISTWTLSTVTMGQYNQEPKNAVMEEGIYDFALSVKLLTDSTNEVSWYFINEDNTYWFGGTEIDTSSINPRFNGVSFGFNSAIDNQSDLTSVVVSEVTAYLGDPINIPSPPEYQVENDFILFLNGVNVHIPSIDGTVVPDPKDELGDNRVFKIDYSGWSESGFRWPGVGQRDTVGVNLTSWTADDYGETDTLFFRLLSDPLNIGQPDFIALFDSQSEEDPIAGVDDVPFRLRWEIPDWAHDGEWHEFAIPLPPRTAAFLDSAKAGRTSNGEELDVEVDSLFMNWEYSGAWASGSQTFIMSRSDPNWDEFDWASVKYIGRHTDHANGGAPIYLDYFTVGVAPEELVDETTSPVDDITIVVLNGINTISWSELEDAFAYNIYFSESPITELGQTEEVTFLGSVDYNEERVFEHELIAPHPDFSKDFISYYAITAISEIGSESEFITSAVTSDLNSEESYAVELDVQAIDDIFDSIDKSGEHEISLSGVEIRNMFPSGYKPFSINENRKIIENGTGGDDDEDLSGKFWVGFGSTNNELIVYAEIKDDSLVFLSSPESPNTSWAYDGWQIGIGNYTPSSFIKSSTHDPFQRGAEPDYQLRASNILGANPFIYEAYTSEVIPNSQTIFEETDYGYRLLTLINTVNLTDNVITQNDTLFDFPDSSEIALYPFNIALDDNDDVNGTRDTQVSWSRLAGDDTWWRNPTKWQTVAFVGRNRVLSTNHYTESVLGLDSKEGFLSDTMNLGIELSRLGDVPIESFQFDIEFDTSKVSLVFIEQTGFLSEEFTVVTNESIPGVLRVSAAGALGIETEGILYGIQIIPKNAGESGISVGEIFINEEKHELLNATLKFYERLCGDVTDDRSVSALDATFILRNTVFLEPQFPLMELDSIAADVTGNGDITAFDAAKVLQYDIGLVEKLSCGGNLNKASQGVSIAQWEILHEDESKLEILIDYSATDIQINSIELQLELPKGVNYKNIEDLQKGWIEISNSENGKVFISAFGVVRPEKNTMVLVLNKDNDQLVSELKGQLMFNESVPVILQKIVQSNIPEEFQLNHNYPNPFNPETNISYSLPERVRVELSIYNVLGQKVAELVNMVQEPGKYNIRWNGSKEASGVYIYKISAGKFTSSKKMILLK